jgi:stage II sporulation protein E
MLNHFLTSRTTESFATVDLVEIDLVLGVASFLKSGAVPSYVIRNRHLYKISSGTFPIGILPEVSVEVTEFELCHGDVILICSDGVSSDIETRENEDSNWFCDFICREWTEDLEAMAEKIIQASCSAASASDDMTVQLLRVRKNGEN